MSKQSSLIPGESIARASVDALLATAQTLLREAADRVREGTVEVSRDELIDQVVACQRVQNTAWAAQSVRLAQVAAIEEVVSPGATPREVRHAIGTYADEWLPQEIGARLGWSDRQTTNRLGDAVDAIRCTPTLFELTAAGTLDPRKLDVVAETLREASPRVARRVESELLAAIDDATAPQSDDSPPADDAGEPVPLTSTKLVRRTRRLLAELSPADAAASARKQRAEAICVQAFPHHQPGLSTVQAILPTEDAMRVLAAVNELARQLHQDTITGKSLDECRVDAFLDLLLGNVSISTTCVVQVPVRSVDEHVEAARATGLRSDERDESTSSLVEAHVEELLRCSARDSLDELIRLDTPTTSLLERRPCTVEALLDPNSGGRIVPRVRVVLGAENTDQLHARPDRDRPPERPPGNHPTDDHPAQRTRASTHSPHTAPRFRIGDVLVEGLGIIPAAVLTELCQRLGTRLTRALVDARTGATVETSDVTYRPGARLRRFVVTRDQHCRFPGCIRPARLDDVDHVVRWPDGTTTAANLQCLCRHHHRAKHEGGWAVSMTAQGVCTWTSPSGRRYITRPAD